nr:MAG TPA: hypothetical protein [Caudoviricetes sp.]
MATNNFLDQAGLSYLWAKIVSAIESHSVTLPDKLVSYKAATTITATEKLNADTLGGYSASYFAKSSDVSSIQGSIKTQASEILKAQQAVSNMESTVSDHTTSIGLLDSNVESLKKTVGNHGTSISNLGTSLENLQQEVKTLDQSIGDIPSQIEQVNTALGTKLDKSGGTMTGPLIAKVGSDQTVAQVRNIIISTTDPSPEVGSDGDVWIKYEA